MRIDSGIIYVAVRELIEFVLRKGSLDSSFVSSNRMALGIKAHKKIQNSMGENYEKEVSLKKEITEEGITFIIEGRTDGIITNLDHIIVDEIKSTTMPLDQIDKDFNELHFAQAKCYAYIYAKEHDLSEIEVQLTYYNINTEGIKRINRMFSFKELKDFFDDLIKRYVVWVKWYIDHIDKRTNDMKLLNFPFETYREGQRPMSIAVYRSIVSKENLYINAPTGIGKTLSTLFPALKAMGEGHVSKIFYLTAKTITRTVAEDTIRQLYNHLEGKATIKGITLTAKQKLCFCEEVKCTPEYCSFADGHFDRVNAAIMDALLTTDLFTRDEVEKFARKHGVCPFEFSLDLALWMDVVICDYNYIFDTEVALKRFLDGKDYVVLIDEAHNLVDRARDMYSEGISKKSILAVKNLISKTSPAIGRTLNKINLYMLHIKKEYLALGNGLVSSKPPKEFYMLIKTFIKECDVYFIEQAKGNVSNELLDLYFTAYKFTKIYELFDKNYVMYSTKENGDVILKLFCIDPSRLIAKALSNFRSTIFFSATLLPMAYYKYMLGGSDAKEIYIASPFNKEASLKLIASDVSTRYQHRALSFDKIRNYIETVAETKVGNYMVFFPSYQYMMDVYEAMKNCSLFDSLYIQSPDMMEEDKEAFLERFVSNPKNTHIAFCVLGGIFSEGIDLTDDRLIGVIIVSVGLPQIGLERELIKDHFDKKEEEGYHYAYTFPGFNKVLQAAGRLIRTERDRGIILLIDDRFNNSLYKNLFPNEWRNYQVVNQKTVKKYIDNFWSM